MDSKVLKLNIDANGLKMKASKTSLKVNSNNSGKNECGWISIRAAGPKTTDSCKQSKDHICLKMLWTNFLLIAMIHLHLMKIHEIVTTGRFSKLEHFEQDEKVRSVTLFGEVWGIGPATTLKLYEKGHRTLDYLKNEGSLTSSQRLGLKYFDDIKKRIPRNEVKDMEMLLQKVGEDILPGVLIVCGGSYRRGKASCGDLDIIITHPDGERKLILELIHTLVCALTLDGSSDIVLISRSRLVSARVLVEGPGVLEVQETYKDAIPLLCSIFLANQGAGEAAEEGRLLLCDDEALMQGEQEAEMMIIEAYAALLLSFLSTLSAEVREAIASCLPNHNLEALVPVLERFVAFHVQLNMISPETHSAVTKVVESCRGP